MLNTINSGIKTLHKPGTCTLIQPPKKGSPLTIQHISVNLDLMSGERQAQHESHPFSLLCYILAFLCSGSHERQHYRLPEIKSFCNGNL